MEIFELIKSSDADAVMQMVNQDPSLVELRDPSGLRPIMVALYYGKRTLAHALRSRMETLDLWEAAAIGDLETARSAVGQDQSLLDAFSPDGFTPLGLAAFFGSLPVLEWLLEQGADPNLAAQNQMSVCPIHSAAANLLVAYGAQVNVAQRGGWTPLHQAADHGFQHLVEFLLEAGADRTLKSSDGRTPGEMALEKGFEATAALLK
jgi:ankyrin repeat protein